MLGTSVEARSHERDTQALANSVPPAVIAWLSKLCKRAWKQLANADQTDSDEVKAILTETLDAIDDLEAKAAEQAPGDTAGNSST